MAQMADISLYTSGTWPLVVASHVRATTIYTGVIHLLAFGPLGGGIIAQRQSLVRRGTVPGHVVVIVVQNQTLLDVKISNWRGNLVNRDHENVSLLGRVGLRCGALLSRPGLSMSGNSCQIGSVQFNV